MLDVVPPTSGRPRSGGRRKRSKPSTHSVVELDWRLPARLRRPVHEELKRQRQRRRAREAIVQFERHPLYPATTQVPITSSPVRPNRGAEHHTGDVYQSGRPSLNATVPPYAGAFVRQKAVVSHTSPRRVPVSKQAHLPQRSPVQQKKPAVIKKQSLPLLQGERDVPYQWTTPSAKAASPSSPRITPRRRRFALPLHISIWPFRGTGAETLETSKKKAQNSDSLTR